MLRKKKVDDVPLSSSGSEKNAPESAYYNAAIEWDVSRTKLIEASEKRAWFVCIILVVMLACSWAGLFFLLPLKKDVPYVVQVDSATGRTEVSQVYNPKRLSFDEVRDKYWINHFISLYERYNYYLVRDDYRIIPLFAEETVLQDYRKMYRGKTSRQNMYKDNVRIDVEIISIMVRQGKHKTAVARFKVTRMDLKTPGNPPIDSRTYTVEMIYDYETLALDEQSRMVNPLGFRVKSYQLAADNT